jgi:hypothetical protein
MHQAACWATCCLCVSSAGDQGQTVVKGEASQRLECSNRISNCSSTASHSQANVGCRIPVRHGSREAPALPDVLARLQRPAAATFTRPGAANPGRRRGTEIGTVSAAPSPAAWAARPLFLIGRAPYVLLSTFLSGLVTLSLSFCWLHTNYT